jgi:hypothetical protein
MASQTKVEPVDGAAAKVSSTAAKALTSNAGGPSRADAEQLGNDASAPASGTGSLASGLSNLADDEDVSLDELMMSDSNDGDDEPDESTDVQGTVVSASEEAAIDLPDGVDLPAKEAVAPFGDNPLADDEAAALAAAAAAQEAAAQAAAAETDARIAAARRAAEAPRPRSSSSPSLQQEASGPAVAAERMTTPPGPPALSAFSTEERDLEPPPSTDEPPMSVELEPLSVRFEAPTDASNESAPPAALAAPSIPTPSAATGVASKRQDGPLPSFEIPEAENARARGLGEEEQARANPRPLATPLSHLSEASEEDDDDAVTHIGLPVVPEAPDYPEPQAGFQVADPDVAALRGFEPELSLADARRATTRILPRIDPAQLEQRRSSSDTNPALTSSGIRREGRAGAWLAGFFKRSAPEPSQPELLQQPRRRAGWLLDTVLPPLSLVLFGSGIGAGIMLLQPDRGAKAAQQAQTIQALAPAAKRPTTLAERAEAGDGDALFKITNMSPNDRSSALTLALERGYQAQKQNEFKEFAKLLEAPGGLDTPNLSTRFLNYATSPETMLLAFSHLLGWPGSTGPDVLYAVWEKAPGGNRAASLAQQLLHSADQRSKATPALITALDLRSATTCDDYLRVLPAVQRDGDQRCSATLRALKHTDGCGDDGQQDCFACLRDGKLLDDALSAIEGRVAPQL